jgi:hypothetical protein
VDPGSFLTTTAEIAIAIAGFSGLVAVLGRRGQGEWSLADVFRMNLLLRSSFGSVLFCLLPVILFSAAVAETTVWVVSSAGQLVVVVGSMARGVRKIRPALEASGEPRPERGFLLMMGAMFIAFVVLHTLNVVVLQTAWPYLVGLTLSLSFAFIEFVRLLRSLWQDR